MIFEKKKEHIVDHKMCFDILYSFCLKHFSFYEELSEIWSKMYTVFVLSTRYSCQILMNFSFVDRFSKSSKI